MHSFGLEPHVLSAMVKDESELKRFLLNVVLNQYISYEFVHIKNIYRASIKHDTKELKMLDDEFVAYLTYEYAKASKDMGKNIYTHIKGMIDDRELFFEKNSLCELSILSYFSFLGGFRYDEFCILWAKKNLTNMANCIPKISRIKPSFVQKVLFEMDDELLKVDFKRIKDKISLFNPLFEEVVFSHKNLEPKMFAT